MGDIVKWNIPIDKNMSVNRVKKVIRDMDCDDIFAIGYNKQKRRIYVRSSSGCSIERSLWLLENAKKIMMED